MPSRWRSLIGCALLILAEARDNRFVEANAAYRQCTEECDKQRARGSKPDPKVEFQCLMWVGVTYRRTNRVLDGIPFLERARDRFSAETEVRLGTIRDCCGRRRRHRRCCCCRCGVGCGAHISSVPDPVPCAAALLTLYAHF